MGSLGSSKKLKTQWVSLLFYCITFTLMRLRDFDFFPFKKNNLPVRPVRLFQHFHVYFLTHQVCFYKRHQRGGSILRRLEFFDSETLAASE